MIEDFAVEQFCNYYPDRGLQQPGSRLYAINAITTALVKLDYFFPATFQSSPSTSPSAISKDSTLQLLC